MNSRYEANDRGRAHVTTKIRILYEAPLPAPASGWDLTIWITPELPTETAMRTWAGWAETQLLALSTTELHLSSGYTRDSRDWASSALAVGPGCVWRYQSRYIAYLDPHALRIPEIPRALAQAGVELVIVFEPAYHSLFPYLDPLWRIVQANQIYGLRLSSFPPQCYVPCELDPAEEGVVALSLVDACYTMELNFSHLHDDKKIVSLQRDLQVAAFRAHPWWMP